MAKLSKSWFHTVFTVTMALMMSSLMTFVVTAVNVGFPSDFAFRWLRSFTVGFSVAVPAIYVLAPLAKKITAALVDPDL